MASSRPQQQPQQQPPRRLTMRELQERKRKAEEAYVACTLFYKEWKGNEGLDMLMRDDDERLLELDRIMGEGVAAIKEGLPNRRVELAQVLYFWSTCLHEAVFQQGRAVSTMREAIALLNPPQTPEEEELLGACLVALGWTLVELGWLTEAEAAFREALPCRLLPNFGSRPLLGLVNVCLQLSRPEEALEHARAAEQWRTESREDRAHTLSVIADAYEAVGQEEKCWEYQCKAFVLAKEEKGDYPATETYRKYRVCLAKRLLAEGCIDAVVDALMPELEKYLVGIDRGRVMILSGEETYFKELRVLAAAKRALGQEQYTAALEADIEDTEAIIQGRSRAVYDALLLEMREERAAEAAAAAPPRTTKKKPSRKQQKRKAAQRRKAAEAAAVVVEGDKKPSAGGTEEAVVEAVAQVRIEEEEQEPEQPAPTPKQELEPDEPEPKECAICLNDLPPPGSADEGEEESNGGVLLACSHTFHADCLARWKDKCLEKGLRFTCAMCRGAVVIVPAGTGAGAGSRAGGGKEET